MKAINFETAGLILSNVPGYKVFVCNNGRIFANLEELMNGLKTMSEKTFEYHVNKDKNDFSTWIYDVVGDIKLAENLRKINDSKSAVKKIKTRIAYLKKNTKKDV